MKLLTFFILPFAFCLSTVAAGIGFNTQPIPGLVGWWTFNEGSGTNCFDYSGNAQTLTNVNVVFYPGVCSSAKSNAANGLIHFNFTNNFTVVCFIRIYSVPASLEFYNQSDGTSSGWSASTYNAACADSSRFSAVKAGASCDIWAGTGTTLTMGWRHLVMGRNATDWFQYVDGIAGTTTSSHTPSAVITFLKLPGSGFLTDDVRLYNRALTAEEIKQLYNGGAGSQR